MRGLNRVILSGNVTGRIDFSTTESGNTEVCTFTLASDRHSTGKVVTAFVKVNVYIDGLVKLCRNKLTKGAYLLVEGELMNRTTPVGKLTEVRAWELVFLHGNTADKEM